jgi:hypothetical protein
MAGGHFNRERPFPLISAWTLPLPMASGFKHSCARGRVLKLRPFEVVKFDQIG